MNFCLSNQGGKRFEKEEPIISPSGKLCSQSVVGTPPDRAVFDLATGCAVWEEGAGMTGVIYHDGTRPASSELCPAPARRLECVSRVFSLCLSALRKQEEY